MTRGVFTAPLEDLDAERVRREHELKLRELLQRQQIKVIAGVELADGVATPIAHGLGRVPAWTAASVVRGATTAGLLEEVRGAVRGGADRTKYVTLRASGFGATITVDLAVL